MQSPLPFSAALRVLRGQMCCRCRSSCSFVALRGQKEVAVAVAVLRAPPCPPRTKVLPLPFFVFLRGPSWTKGSCRRCSSPRPPVSSADKCVAVAVLRGPSRPFADKRTLQSPLPFSAALRVLRGQRCCRCRSSCSFVALRGQKEVTVAVAVLRPSVSSADKGVAVAFAVLRGPSWTKGSCLAADKGVAVAVLRVPSWPFVDKKKLQSPLQFSAPPRVLRGQMCCRCRSSRSFAALRGQKEVTVAVAVLRAPPCPPRTNVLPPFFGQKDVVAVAVLRGPPCPPRTKVLPLPFFVFLRGPSWTKRSYSRRCSSPRPTVSSADKCVAVAVFAVLRGPSWTKRSYSRRCSSPRPPCPPRTNVLPLPLRVPSWPFVDKRKLQSPLPFSAPHRVLRGQRCCRCRSSCSFVALRGQKEVAVAVAVLRAPPCPPWTNVLPLPFFAVLRGPSRTKGSCSRRCRSPRPTVSSADKGVAVLRGPSRPFVDKRKLQSPLPFSAALRVLRGQMSCRCSSPRPFVDRPNYDLANLSSENRQRALTI